MQTLIELAERGWLPDRLIRTGIRQLLRARLRSEESERASPRRARTDSLIRQMRRSPIALETGRANEQHYEVPAEFFGLFLGPRMKYSCGLWTPGVRDLAGAEEAMLRLTAERAGIRDGMKVLDLGCGWGSLALWVAEHNPLCEVVAVSNSDSQRRFIQDACRARGLSNLRALTSDMNDFDPGERFDRIVSVEMFEHMRNYGQLLERIAGWLRPGGRLFVHIFAHRLYPYLFQVGEQADWMARHFFTGGLMPSDDLLWHFADHLVVESQWRVNGRDYERTLLAWLQRLDRRREAALRVLREVYGDADAALWLQRWRIFLMACADLFGHDNGRQWSVSHYLLQRREEAEQAWARLQMAG